MEEILNSNSNKRSSIDSLFSPIPKRRKNKDNKEFILILKPLSDHILPFSSTTNHPCKSILLKPDSIYTIGRSNHYCQFVFHFRRVSNRHCQILYDSFDNKVIILDGFLISNRHSCCKDSCKDENKIKKLFRSGKQLGGRFVRASTNGVFVNGVRIGESRVMELSVGDEVSFACGNKFDSSFGVKIGFSVERFDLGQEFGWCFGRKWLIRESETVGRRSFEGVNEVVVVEKEKGMATRGNDGFVYMDYRFCSLGCEDLIARAVSLLIQCRETLRSSDPIQYIRGCMKNRENKWELNFPASVCDAEDCNGTLVKDAVAVGDGKLKGLELKNSIGGVQVEKNYFEEIHQENSDLGSKKDVNFLCSSSGNKFYLNRLEFIDDNLFNKHSVVSLPELLHPIATLSRMFIATFTSDVLWFLSYCEVPNHLPITIACHNTEKCWSGDPDKRTSTPYSDFPNLVLVYPPFPEVIAFGKDRKKQGIACHHPKLLVLQREDSVRVIVTSANLVSKQWNSVTNTVWWQDFPRRSEPDYSSLFAHHTEQKTYEGFKSDFAAQLAGFVASLLVDVPSQAQWITELTKYDFGGAVGHLVASVPGMHRQMNPYPFEPMNFQSAKNCSGMKFLGSVEASVVGLKYRFHSSADSNGAQLKTLAAFLRKCRENAFGMSEAVLRRNTNIPADANAVSVLICDLDEFSEGDYIQLGFLPRTIANWVAPLCDAGFFRFSACIYPKEVLAAALEGSNSKVRLILYVSQGPKFSEISSLIKPVHVAAICSLVASVQRCSGLWRLKEVLSHYKWPELLETDFIYGSSSIGTSIDPKFLAAFSAAAGKKSYQLCDSEESDPEWGVWSASEEVRNPSMRILFPTIERVKEATCGIWPSRRVLCFSEKTWQRLRTTDILHDAIPNPSYRVGYPMHVKVARRRFQSKTGKSSCGWVYSGSHNFSPAAWGRPVSTTAEKKTDGFVGTSSSLGSRLHICNYELGIIFVVPPSNATPRDTSKCSNLDDIVLPFVVPAPKYRHNDRPATAQAMREALAELAELEKEVLDEAEAMEEEMVEGEEVVEVTEYVPEEKDDEKAYAETLWSQVDSSDG